MNDSEEEMDRLSKLSAEKSFLFNEEVREFLPSSNEITSTFRQYVDMVFEYGDMDDVYHLSKMFRFIMLMNNLRKPFMLQMGQGSQDELFRLHQKLARIVDEHCKERTIEDE